MFVVAFMLVAATVVPPAIGDPDIVYKTTDAYKLIWNDNNSNGWYRGAVWSPENYQIEFCSLGDVATGNRNKPTTKALLLTAKKAGILTRPLNFTWIWDDKASSAILQTSVYRMNAPTGYTCLGAVSVPNWDVLPDASKYCCVKDEYVVRADIAYVYIDRGTSAWRDVSFWKVVRAEGDQTNVILGGNFIAHPSHHRPYVFNAFLLKASDKISKILEKKPLNLHENEQLKHIWSDSGSDAMGDVSIWRCESQGKSYSVGDMAAATHTKPRHGFLLRATDANDDSMRLPDSYSPIWARTEFERQFHIKFWKVNCPSGYVALGNIATSGNQPKAGDVYCVKTRYTIRGSSGSYSYIWKDIYDEAAERDVSIFGIKPTSSKQQTVLGFKAFRLSYPDPPYLLNTKFVTYWTEKPIEKIIITNVKYDLNSEKLRMNPHFLLNSSTLSVHNRAEKEVALKDHFRYHVTETAFFTFSQSMQPGIPVEITAGVPHVGNETLIGDVTTSTFTTGSTSTITRDGRLWGTFRMPARSKTTVEFWATEYKSDIPFTARIKKIYHDGRHVTSDIKGLFQGVYDRHVRILQGKIFY